jgi:AraC family transcriptional regulator of adaptative response/methylated-DNA-[protein]-cysteine methyltransferase
MLCGIFVEKFFMYDYNRIAKAIDFIRTHFKEQLSLDDVARSVYLSPFHFQRMFTEWAGVSPKKFQQFLTIEYAKKLLSEKDLPLSEVAYESGLSGSGRLHDLFVNIESMTPGEYKKGGEGLNIQYSFNDSFFGKYLIASTPKGICTLHFNADKKMALVELKEQWHAAKIREGSDRHHESVHQLFTDHQTVPAGIKLHIKGSAFQLKVWEALLKIPEGRLTSYSQVAAFINEKNASRAVGSAIASNPVGYLIPCHRVIKNAGAFGDYRWGVTRKMAMIGWEASQITKAS